MIGKTIKNNKRKEEIKCSHQQWSTSLRFVGNRDADGDGVVVVVVSNPAAGVHVNINANGHVCKTTSYSSLNPNLTTVVYRYYSLSRSLALSLLCRSLNTHGRAMRAVFLKRVQCIYVLETLPTTHHPLITHTDNSTQPEKRPCCRCESWAYTLSATPPLSLMHTDTHPLAVRAPLATARQ